jgi:hypothetical protein
MCQNNVPETSTFKTTDNLILSAYFYYTNSCLLALKTWPSYTIHETSLGPLLRALNQCSLHIAKMSRVRMTEVSFHASLMWFWTEWQQSHGFADGPPRLVDTARRQDRAMCSAQNSKKCLGCIFSCVGVTKFWLIITKLNEAHFLRIQSYRSNKQVLVN